MTPSRHLVLCLTAVLLAAPPAFAQVKVLGWFNPKAPSAPPVLVYEVTTFADQPVMCGDSDCGVHHIVERSGVVVDLAQAKEGELILLSSNAEPEPESQGATFDALLEKTPPTVQAAMGRATPDKAHQLDITITTGQGQWKGAAFEWKSSRPRPAKGAAAEEGTPYGHALVFDAPQGKPKHLLADVPLRAATGTLTPYWHPGGVFLALAVVPTGADADVAVARTTGPAIEVLGDESVFKARVKDAQGQTVSPIDRVAHELWRQGFNLVRTARAVKKRDLTAVYATPGAMADVASVARALVGGTASVEPLSWKTDCDVVVALGAAAK